VRHGLGDRVQRGRGAARRGAKRRDVGKAGGRRPGRIGRVGANAERQGGAWRDEPAGHQRDQVRRERRRVMGPVETTERPTPRRYAPGVSVGALRQKRIVRALGRKLARPAPSPPRPRRGRSASWTARARRRSRRRARASGSTRGRRDLERPARIRNALCPLRRDCGDRLGPWRVARNTSWVLGRVRPQYLVFTGLAGRGRAATL
jgi:hypothetical protein